MTGSLVIYTKNPSAQVVFGHDSGWSATAQAVNGVATIGPFDLPDGNGATLTIDGTAYRGVLWISKVNPVNGSASFAVDTFPSFKRPVAIPRSPLVFPSCGSCPSPTSYDKTLPMAPQSSRDYLRADCWGVTLPGLPFVSGGSSEHPERVLSWFFDVYPAVWQPQILTAHATRGYTHFYLSWPDSRVRAGATIASFVQTCLRIKQWGFYVHVKLWSKDFDPGGQNLAQFQASLDPLLDALFAANAVDEGSFWEYDANNTTQDAVAVHQYFGNRFHAGGASFWCHFLPEHGFWGTGNYSDWWTALVGAVDGLDYQGNPAYDIGQQQARLVDFLNERGGQAKLRAFELYGAAQFSGDHPTEDEANALGYLTICTKANTPTWGCGAGFRAPDGSAC
jgi:hypothetical protein